MLFQNDSITCIERPLTSLGWVSNQRPGEVGDVDRFATCNEHTQTAGAVPHPRVNVHFQHKRLARPVRSLLGALLNPLLKGGYN